MSFTTWFEEYEPYLEECYQLLVHECRQQPRFKNYNWGSRYAAFCRLVYDRSYR